MPGLGDLLHLVSGQTLLGSVRERHAQNLGSAGHQPAHLGPGTGALGQLSGYEAGPYREALSISADATGLSSASRVEWARGSTRSGDVRRLEEEISQTKQPAHGTGDQSSHRVESLRRDHVSFDSRSTIRPRSKQPADVLDHYLTSDMGVQLVATAVRQHAGDFVYQEHASSGITFASTNSPDSKADSGSSDTAASTITVYAADEGGHMLCRVDQKGHINPAKQLRPGVQHQIISSATPFVRSLHFVVNTGTVPSTGYMLLHLPSHRCMHQQCHSQVCGVLQLCCFH